MNTKQDSHETVPYTMPLSDGRTVFVRGPARMTDRDRDGSLTFKPAGLKLLERIRALAVDLPDAPAAGHLTAVREALELTQAQLGEKLGRSPLTISRWERGSARPEEEALGELRRLVDETGKRGVVLTG